MKKPVKAKSTNNGLWPLRFKLNGKKVSTKVPPTRTLLDFLRLELGLTGTKGACLEGECGSCYVLVDGKPMNSCLMLAPQVQDREVTTIEGLARNKKLDVIQQKFIDCGAVQCGYCTPGLILSAKALLAENPHPTREEFLVGMEGNICRCTGYNKILRACEQAADEMGLKKK
ncbi:MAG TPA: (2Fe-2S)-binding protein [Verrucomicrobiae bacterium]|nr:(2Fe-2S)-binding protein [Verrucomicrobiae bacterium]